VFRSSRIGGVDLATTCGAVPGPRVLPAREGAPGRLQPQVERPGSGNEATSGVCNGPALGPGDAFAKDRQTFPYRCVDPERSSGPGANFVRLVKKVVLEPVNFDAQFPADLGNPGLHRLTKGIGITIEIDRTRPSFADQAAQLRIRLPAPHDEPTFDRPEIRIERTQAPR